LQNCQKVETANIRYRKKPRLCLSIRKIIGKYPSQVSVVKAANGKIITDLDAVKARWRDYFSQLYNDPNEVNEEFLDNIQDSCNSENIPGIGEDEVLAAITKLKHRKAARIDNISAEEIQAATQRSGLTAVHRLCSMAWEQEQIPSDWKSAVIIPVHKKKDTLDCSNYRGISLLCHCSKTFSWIILQRIKSRTEEMLTEAHTGYRANRSTIDQIFTLRQLAEKV